MPPKRTDRDRLFSTMWVHVFEEDGAEGAVYRPEDAAIPLSRRPRERFELRADGSAAVFSPGPDDRPVERLATWRDEGGVIVIRPREGGDQLRIVGRSPGRMVVQARRAGP